MVKNIGIDKFLLIAVICLLLFGLIMVYSSTMIMAKENFGDSFYFLKRQVMWLSVGFIIFLIIVTLRQPIYLDQKMVWLVLILSTAALVLVFFGGKINNSYRWIRFAGFSLQPSEFAKIAAVLYLSYMLGRKDEEVNNLKKLALILIPVFLIEILILKEPDYGNFFLILFITMVVLFIAGLKIRYFAASLAGLIPLFYLIIKLSPDKMNRIVAFFNPDKYGATFNFQVMQSLNAVGSGGIFGQGLGKSTQKLFFLPYAYTDFIYSIIGEEVGLIGALFVIMLFMIFLARGVVIAKHSGNRHTYLLVIGLTFLVVCQAMINISVTLGIFPTTGIPLPFISIGGSSLVSSLIVTGIIINVSRHRKTVLLND